MLMVQLIRLVVQKVVHTLVISIVGRASVSTTMKKMIVIHVAMYITMKLMRIVEMLIVIMIIVVNMVAQIGHIGGMIIIVVNTELTKILILQLVPHVLITVLTPDATIPVHT